LAAYARAARAARTRFPHLVVRRYSIPATTRASFYVYNTPAEVDALVKGVRAAQDYFEK
jgi:selenocysteine lyase/cysteine desulfurase